MTSQDAQNVHRNQDLRKDQGSPQKQQIRDSEAAGAFTFRQMTTWQLWSISIASLAVVIGLLFYAAS